MKEKNSNWSNTNIKTSKPSDETIEMIAWEVLNEIEHPLVKEQLEVSDDIYNDLGI